MKRIALIAASSAALIAASLAVAQTQSTPPATPPATTGQDRPAASGSETRDSSEVRKESREDRRAERRERMAERMEARMNERLARLRTEMDLKPEQVPLFERVETLIKQNAQQRRERMGSMRDMRESFRDADIMEKLDMMASRQSERATRTKDMADAVRPLWQTLSDRQKTVVRRAVREVMAEGRSMMMMRHHGMHHGGHGMRGGSDSEGHHGMRGQGGHHGGYGEGRGYRQGGSDGDWRQGQYGRYERNDLWSDGEGGGYRRSDAGGDDDRGFDGERGRYGGDGYGQRRWGGEWRDQRN